MVETKSGQGNFIFSINRRALLGGSVALLAAPSLGLAKGACAVRTFELKAPDGRAITISEWRPAARERGLILFSHGANSSPHLYEALISAWVARGHRVLAPLHVDSETHPERAKYPPMASWKTRIEDMRALSAHVGKRPWVAAGHSYGALVALTLGGATPIPPQGVTGPLSDPNAHAVIAFSPPAPMPMLITEAGFATLSRPALIQTGTKDIPPGARDWAGHMAAYNAAAAGGHRYGLVLEDVDHYFGGLICRYGVPGPKQYARLEDAKRISGLFLRSFGEIDRRAQRLLDSAVSDAFPVRLIVK